MRAVDSTSDARTENNVMRHQYRVLSDAEKSHMARIKDAGQRFYDLLADYDGPTDTVTPWASREASLARTKIEEAVMWAVKHITA